MEATPPPPVVNAPRKDDSIQPDHLEAAHASLVKYALHTLESSIHETKMNGHTIVPNICVSPLVSTKAWAYLSHMANGKTKQQLQNAVNQMLGQSSFESSDKIIRHFDPVGGIVRFFADYPKELTPEEDPDNSAIYENCKMTRLVFKVDHMGGRSIHQINLEFSKSSSDRIRYVVREANAPHWRTVTLMVSAADATFYWKHTAPAQINFMSFKNGKLLSKVACWKIEDTFCYFTHSSDAKVLELESHDEKSSLILIQFADPDRQLDFVTLEEILKTASANNKTKIGHTKQIKLMLPQITSATPIFACRTDENYTTKRVFDREKSELSGFLSKSSTKVSSIRTLWDHYHKVVFRIVDGPKDDKPVNPEEAVHMRQDFVGFAEEKSKNKKSAYANVTKSIGTKYYEEYLNMQKCGPNTEIIEPKDDIVAFNSPFYFIYAKHIGTDTIPFIHSIGRFTNGDIDNWKHQEA